MKSMRIGLVLSSTPGYSETFFNSKINGLKENGFEVLLFVQNKNASFNLCPVFKSPKVFKNPLLQLISMFFVFIKLLPYFITVKKYIVLEKQQKSSISNIIKKIYLNAHLLVKKVDWLHFGFATQALEKEFVASAIGAKVAVSFRGFDINVYPLKHPNCYQNLWKQVDKVHSISNYLLQQAYGLGLQKEKKFKIVTPSVNIHNLNFEPSIKLSEPLQIITIARLHWIKGLDIAIETMKVLKEKGVKFTYRIIGNGSREYIERFKYQVYEFDLTGYVTFEGALATLEVK